MAAWAQEITEAARRATAGWPESDQALFRDLVDRLCRSPRRGSYNEEDGVWVFEMAEEPWIRVTYHLDRSSRHLRVVHAGHRHVVWPIYLFLSYSSKDRVWFRHLLRELQPLRDFDISLWTDRDIPPSERWDRWIEDGVARAASAVLLVSESFLENEYIRDRELRPFLERAEKSDGVGADGLPLLLFWLPLVHQRYLEGRELGRRLLVFQALRDPRRPLGFFSRLRARWVLPEIRVAIHRRIYAKFQRLGD